MEWRAALMFIRKDEEVTMTAAKLDSMPSTFQEYCLRMLNRFFEARELAPTFGCIHGKQEVYFKAELEIDGHSLKMFVYHDEAGFFWDGEWVICEEQDFDSDVEMVEAFLSKLGSRLMTTDGPQSDPPGAS